MDRMNKILGRLKEFMQIADAMDDYTGYFAFIAEYEDLWPRHSVFARPQCD